MKSNILYHIIVLSLLLSWSCQKEEEMPNPFIDIGKNLSILNKNRKKKEDWKKRKRKLDTKLDKF